MACGDGVKRVIATAGGSLVVSHGDGMVSSSFISHAPVIVYKNVTLNADFEVHLDSTFMQNVVLQEGVGHLAIICVGSQM